MVVGDKVQVLDTSDTSKVILGIVDTVSCDEIVVAVKTPKRNYLMAVDPNTKKAKGMSQTFIMPLIRY